MKFEKNLIPTVFDFIDVAFFSSFRHVCISIERKGDRPGQKTDPTQRVPL